MSSLIRRYVPVKIQTPKLDYAWNDLDVEAAEQPIDRKLSTRLRKLSLRAAAALGIATAEWILLRYNGLHDHEEPRWYLETAWVQLIDARYGYEWDPLQAGLAGPIEGPIRQALMWVGAAIECVADESSPHEEVATLIRLCEHVLPTREPFVDWRDTILERFERVFPATKADPRGDVVPVEAVDPEYEFSAVSIEPLVNAYLTKLDRADNPFLRSPEDLIDEGFEGEPYVFHLERDRHQRSDW